MSVLYPKKNIQMGICCNWPKWVLDSVFCFFNISADSKLAHHANQQAEMMSPFASPENL
jgi:hypothetical protein